MERKIMKKSIMGWQKVSALLFVVAMVFSLTLFPLSAFAEDELSESKTEIQIVHTNDIHGYYTQTSRGAIGFAYLKALAQSEQTDLIVDVGDTYRGQAFAKGSC